MQAKLLLADFSFSKRQVDYIQDEYIQDLVLNNTNHEIKNIKLVNTDKPYGMMVGIPTKPQLILSKGLYDNFGKLEIEYVVLHESAHYKYAHTIQQVLFFIIFIAVGLAVLKFMHYDQNKLVLLSVLLGFVLGIIYLQVARIHEYQADRYAVKHISDPRGMIEATKKFESFYKNGPTRNKILYMIFYRGVPYEERIKMAEKEL